VTIKKIRIGDKEYPEALKHIYDPPRELFVRGGFLAEDKNAVAIVGTRRATLYGLRQCERLSYELALKGITIISGMARGIDSAAHRGALKAGGRTIAVLGSGHDDIYPPENRKLYAEIAESGAAISEFPPDTPPSTFNFPRRNRIISGLSKGVVVVEAAKRSGALITANFALQQGREVFAMPGNISSTRSDGPNALIKEGAKLVKDAGDILEELRYVMDIEEIEKSPWNAGAGSIASMSPEERKVFDILSEEPKAIGEISHVSKVPTHKISAILIRLEMKRLAKMLPGENFVKA
jgi:DNA processing protein